MKLRYNGYLLARAPSILYIHFAILIYRINTIFSKVANILLLEVMSTRFLLCFLLTKRY